MPIERIMDAPQRMSQMTSAIRHLEKAVAEATDQYAKLQERLHPICRTTAKPCGESLKREPMVPTAETIESAACQVDTLIQRMQDTHEGLEL